MNGKIDNGPGKAIGIDLGTTNSSLAIERLNVEIIPNNENEDFTPSVVAIGLTSIKDGKALVGKKAVNIRKKNPLHTITASKRLMGAHFHSEEIKRYLANNLYAYKVEERPKTPGEVVISIDGQLYAPEAIAAEILKKIKADGEQKIGQINRAVITVPAYFNDKAKHATKKAAEMAGFSVSRLLPEPTAAAISFNLKENKEGVVLVYDFGGGTFDCSLLNMGDGQFIEMGKSGDMWPGGNDIDVLIIKETLTLIEQEYSLDSIDLLIEKLPLKEEKKKDILSLIEFCDHYENVINGLDNKNAQGELKAEKALKRIKILKKKYDRILISMGANPINITEIDPENIDPKQVFVAEITKNQCLPENSTSIEVLKKGYRLHGEVLRPTEVILNIKNIT